MEKKTSTLINFFFAALLVGAVFLAPARAEAAASFVIAPATAVVPASTQFTVSVLISSDQAVNAAQGTVTFPTDRLQVVQISKAGSIFQFWSQEPSFSNANGTVDFSGGLPSPGFIGQGGLALKIIFRASGRGTAAVNIVQGAILANDGLGTNVLNSIRQGIYTIGSAPASTPPTEIANQITSRAYPNSNSWYSQPTADFSWTITPDVDRIAYELVQSPGSKPSQGYEPTDHVQYSMADRSDGVWYFNLQLRTRGTWGKVLTKKIKADRTPPSTPNIRNITTDPTDPRPTFALSSEDLTSGIKSYRVKVGGGDWFSPVPQDAGKITLPLQGPGKHLLTVEAADLAGNVSAATFNFTVKPIASPTITDYPRNIAASPPIATAGQEITVKGLAPGAASVKVYLQNRNNTLALSSAVAEDGSWSASYPEVLSSGKWALTAQAEDSRGALSFPTEPVFISVNDTAGNLIRFFASWGAVVLVLVLALVILVFAILTAWARLKHYRLKLKREIMAAQVQIIKDFQQVEKDLGGRTAKARHALAGDLDVLARDMGKELEKIKKDVG
jgi:hypothetical protein